MELEPNGVHLHGLQGTFAAALFVGLIILWGYKLFSHRDILIRISGFVMMGSALWIAFQILAGVGQ